MTATLSILDMFNNPVLRYTGPVTVSDSDAPAVAADDGPPTQESFTAADDGTLSFPVTFLTSGTQTLTAIDGNGLISVATVTVNAGTAVQFSVDPPAVQVGTAAPVTVTAYDAYGNVVTGYTGAVTLTAVNGTAAAPITSSSPTSPGTYDFHMTFSQAGGQKLVATGGGVAGAGAVVVTPAPYSLSQSIVSAGPTVVAAGGQVAVTLTVRDAQGNQETGGGLTVAFGIASGSSTGGNFGATVDNGDGSYSVTFTTATAPGLVVFNAMIDGTAVSSSSSSATVIKATPTITWTTPTDMTYGTAVGNAQLDATASTAGTFSYTPLTGKVLDVGDGQTLSVTFSPTNTTTYNNATATVTINVNPAASELSVNPVNLTYGEALANSQLGGLATWTVGGNVVTVPGSWSYASAAGTVLSAGTGKSESVTFTPTDSTDYSPVTTTVTVNVSPAALTITANNQTKVYGAGLPVLTASYSGFVNGDTAASLTLPPTLTSTAAAGKVMSQSSPYMITDKVKRGGSQLHDYVCAWQPHGHPRAR